MLVILGIAVLLFGANKSPKLARSSGQAMGEFRRGREDIEAEIHSAASDATDSDGESATSRDGATAIDPEDEES